ncbi:MAG: NERD domain-containing protein kinase family protein [Smithellaceae bacterium]
MPKEKVRIFSDARAIKSERSSAFDGYSAHGEVIDNALEYGTPLIDSTQSLFEHESNAINEIRQRMETRGLGHVCQNLYIHDTQTNSYLEVDVVAICHFGVYVIELKHWTGNIQIRPNNWLVNNSFSRKDPHILNSIKAKILRGILERRFPQITDTYVESVVVLTNMDATVDGASSTTSSMHNPTFHGIDRLIDYLKCQKENKKHVLDEMHAKATADYLISLNIPDCPKGLQFPGYEIVEYLYQYTDRIEVIARRTDVRYQQLSRLRVFFIPHSIYPKEKKLYHERATATLNAVAKVGDHPNILKVWSVPNDYGYIVEGSDWSQEGTLRDILDRDKKFDTERAVDIIKGILKGLYAIHEKDVIHRELCPENILIVEGMPKLTNFDLSYQLEDDRQTVIPDPSKLKRSPYIAPEVYKADPSLSETADLFSVGVILYEMLTGERPFGHSSSLETTDGRLSSQAQQKLKSIPAYISQLISDLICIDATKRPQKVEDILDILDTKIPVEDIIPNPRLSKGDNDGLYEITEVIQEGVESQLYKADGPKGRKVVLKLFNIGVLLARILNECEMSRVVQHPAIVHVDNHARWKDGRFYITFDYVDGFSFRSYIGKERPSNEQFQRVAGMLLDGLLLLHTFIEDGANNPILHNDIKPDNILLTKDYRPVLIDFGIASHPQISIYSGTKYYIAPDLHVGTDRDYCIGGDLYALGVTLFEWYFGRLPKPEDFSDDASQLWEGINITFRSWFAKAVSLEAEIRFKTAEQMREDLPKVHEDIIQEKEEVTEQLPGKIIVPEAELSAETKLERIDFDLKVDQHPNTFVEYLNTLHCRDASSENALAESQANNPLFRLIHVSHPLTDKIQEVLLNINKKHVILTGHAGDGKSTIGLEIFKRLTHVAFDQPLEQRLKNREDIKVKDKNLTIIKDLSEWKKENRLSFLNEMLQKKGPRFLLISNTGTLIDTFREFEKQSKGDTLEIESKILTAISKEDPEDFPFRGAEFIIINLAMMDNLFLAEKIFEKMVGEEKWCICSDQNCRMFCPIYRNVTLIQKNYPVVRERLFLAFRRMYEYGTRITIRQITAHFSYMITSGLEYADILRLSMLAEKPLMAEFMFYNRFFGDNGKEEDLPALQLRSVREVRNQDFGQITSPTWERRLWLQSKGLSFQIDAQSCDEEFELLRKIGANIISDDEGLNDGQARQQVRRMLYFLHRFNNDDTFIKTFLRSAAILNFVNWQLQTAHITQGERSLLKRKIFHVLQEQFSGVRLPEGVKHDNNLYITLSRRKYDMRQSAQVVLARFDTEREFDVELKQHIDLLGIQRRELVLKGKGTIDGIRLVLNLPFLDYVIMRNQGGIGETLHAAFVDRLERLKAQLIKKNSVSNEDDIMLVRLRTEHTFRRQIFAVQNNQMEVTDA